MAALMMCDKRAGKAVGEGKKPAGQAEGFAGGKGLGQSTVTW